MRARPPGSGPTTPALPAQHYDLDAVAGGIGDWNNPETQRRALEFAHAEIGPTAALGAHLELDLALDGLLGSRVRTLIHAGQTARQAAPAELRDALKTIADGRTVRPAARRLAVDLAARIEDAMRRQPAPTRITMTLERGEGRPDRDMLDSSPMYIHRCEALSPSEHARPDSRRA